MKTSRLKTLLEGVRKKGILLNTFLPFTEENVVMVLGKFECLHCGYCCTQLSPISIVGEEIAEIADFLGITVRKFKKQYTTCKGGLYHLPCPCPFYNGGCRIYPVRPATCVQYPIRKVESNGKEYIGLASTCEALEEQCLAVMKRQLKVLKI